MHTNYVRDNLPRQVSGERLPYATMDTEWQREPLRDWTSRPAPISATSTTSSLSRYEELRRKTHQSHLAYLTMEDTPEKLEYRNKIQSLIAELLSLVPHTHKFIQPEIANCLNRSIIDLEDFSAYRAGLAFETIEKFATNVLNHPWRKEYLTVCPYSGYYKHVIEKQLLDANTIFYAMGYKDKCPSGVLQLESPVDPDKLAKVSLDCLVAHVECQMMVQVQDTLANKGIEVNFSEIYAARTRFVCGKDDLVRILAEAKTKMAQQISNLPLASPTSKVSRSSINQAEGRNGWSRSGEPGNSAPKQNGRYAVSSRSTDDQFSTGSFDLMHFPLTATAGNQSAASSFPHTAQVPSSPVYMSPYSPTNPSPPVFNYPIAPPPAMFAGEGPFADSRTLSRAPAPTAANYGSQPPRTRQFADNLTHSLNRASLKNSTALPGLDAGTLPKPTRLVSRNAIPAAPFDRGSSQRTVSSDSREEAYSGRSALANNADVQKNPTASGRPLGAQAQNHFVNGKELKTPPASPANPTMERAKTEFAFADEVDGLSPHLSSVNLRLPLASNHNDSIAQGQRWSCTSCTYLNGGDAEVCEMCSRSKEKGCEGQPLVSGGKECPRCTLVNYREKQFCSACGSSLADSPTYI